MPRIIGIVLVLFLFAFAHTGCVTPSYQGKCPAIYVTKNGRMTIDGEIVPINDLGKRLKAMGVPTKTAIYVSIKKGTPNSVLTMVGRSLASANYRKFMLVGPTEATAELSTSTTSSSKTSSSSSTPSQTKTTKTSKTSSTTKKKSSSK